MHQSFLHHVLTELYASSLQANCTNSTLQTPRRARSPPAQGSERSAARGTQAFAADGGGYMAMGQNPNRLAPSEHLNPTTKIGSRMGGEFTNPQKRIPLVLTHRVTLWGLVQKESNGQPICFCAPPFRDKLMSTVHFQEIVQFSKLLQIKESPSDCQHLFEASLPSIHTSMMLSKHGDLFGQLSKATHKPPRFNRGQNLLQEPERR